MQAPGSTSRCVRRLTFLVAALCLFLVPAPALAVGLGVTPGALYFDVGLFQGQTRSLTVFNQSDSPGTFELYVDEAYADWVTLDPSSFTLEARGTRTVDMTLRPPVTFSTAREFTLYVVSFSEGSEPSLGAGIKVPVTVTLPDWPMLIMIVGGGAALTITAVVLLLRVKRRNRTVSG